MGTHSKISSVILMVLLRFVIETRDNLLCVVDRIRSIPLFYTKTDAQFIISDDANYIQG